MAPPSGGKEYHDEDDYYPSGTATARASTLSFLKEDPTTMSVEDVLDVLPTPTDINYLSRPYHIKPYPSMTGPPTEAPPPWVTSGAASPFPGIQSTSPTWRTSTVTATSQSNGLSSTQRTISSSVAATSGAPSPSNSSHPWGSGEVGWGPIKDRMDTGGMYAAAAVTPIVVLAMIAAIVFFCMRKRKRQRGEATAAEKVEEMKMRSRAPPTTQAYMASSGATPQYALSNNHLLPPPNPALMQPIILGPIPSGTNGAYFTGMDTSDAVSMTSASNLRPNPFSDNESLSEPPPPYRPRSVAPPSFTNSSRHSSFRAPNPPPETSRTHLIERSPFEDPSEDEDVISDLSGPTAGRNEDAMSAVSDLSYQNDPVTNRPTL